MRPTRMLYRPGVWDVSTHFFRIGEMLLLRPFFPGSGTRLPAMFALRRYVVEWSIELLGSVLTDITL